MWNELLPFLLTLLLLIGLGVSLAYLFLTGSGLSAEKKLEHRIEFSVLSLASAIGLVIIVLFRYRCPNKKRLPVRAA